MKRSGILNGTLAGELARLGHTDQVLICDSGMPIPRDVPTVDLAFQAGIPAFGDVFDGVVDELVIEGESPPRRSSAETPSVTGCSPTGSRTSPMFRTTS